MQTLLTYRTNARNRLDESSAIFWTDAQINQVVNEALEDLYSRLQLVQSLSTSIGIVTGTQSYALPSDLLVVDRIETVIAGFTTPLFPIEPRDAANRFGQNATNGPPQFYSTFGTPGQTTGADQARVILYPAPGANGALNVYYERMPVSLILDTDTSLLPPGWDRLVTMYAVMQAAVKDRDYQLADFSQKQYESLIAEMSSDTRKSTNDTEYSDGSRRLVGGLVNRNSVRSPSDSRGR